MVALTLYFAGMHLTIMSHNTSVRLGIGSLGTNLWNCTRAMSSKLPKDIPSISVHDGGGGIRFTHFFEDYEFWAILKNGHFRDCLLPLDRWCYLFYIYSLVCVLVSKHLLVYFSADLVPLVM